MQMDSQKRAQRDAEALREVHDRIRDIDELGKYGDLLDHLARKVRVARDEARYLAAEHSSR